MEQAKTLHKKATGQHLFYASAAVSGVLVLATSSLAFFVPDLDRNLKLINLALFVLAFPVNFYLLKRARDEITRTLQESNAREHLLNDALKRAESSDLARRAIIANMSHEFRTPLNSVIGFAELLTEGETDAERAEMARCVQRGGWELLDLVNSLVKTAELSSGDAKPTETVAFTLEELIADVGAGHEKEIRAKGLRLSSRCDGKRVLLGDMSAISAVLGILVSNSVKYSAAGIIELRARELSVSDGNQVTVECAVADQGGGIDKEAMDKLFRPFEQGETPLLKKYSGMGVGLYNAKRMTEALRGDLRLESTVGVGTTAYLILPLEAGKARGE